MTTLLLLYAGLIPVVPLIGAQIFKRRSDDLRRNVCYILFIMQLLLSAAYVLTWFSR